MLKKAQYKCWGFGFDPDSPKYNHVVYTIIGDCCYFSGIEMEHRTSTVNTAESIIKVIADQEMVPVMNLRYFDLQTHSGYESLIRTSGIEKLHAGDYELKELTLEENLESEREGGITEIEVEGEKGWLMTQDSEGFTVASWKKVDCPQEVLDLFREFIGFPQ